MTDLTFHSELVDPFYLQFMNCNVLDLPDKERKQFAAQFRATLPRFDDALLRAMLTSSWRPSKVAAWAIAAGRRRALLPDLVVQLGAVPWYAEHLCIAVASLTEVSTGASASALGGYLDRVLSPERKELPTDDALSVEWALAALESVDSAAAATILAPGGAWQRFLDLQPRLGLLAARRAQLERRLENARRCVPEALLLIERELDVGGRYSATQT